MFPTLEEQLAYYEKQLNRSPKGRLARRLEGGRLRLYYEDGDLSFPVPEDMLQMLRRGTGNRKAAEKEIRDLEYWIHRDGDHPGIAYAGDALRAMAAPAAELQRRDCFADLEAYLNGDVKEPVCVLYGLKGTGKTTLMHQAVAGMHEEDFARTAYYAVEPGQRMHEIWWTLKNMEDSQGTRIAFVDGITETQSFLGCASDFLDLDMKLVFSGTESFAFDMASHYGLEEKLFLIHTTWMSYDEYARLTGMQDMDYYLEHGGVLYPSFTEKDLDGYLDDSVAANLEIGLMNCTYGCSMATAEIKRMSCEDELRPFILRLIYKAAMDFLFNAISSAEGIPQAFRDLLHDAVLREYMRRNDEEFSVTATKESAECLYALMEQIDFMRYEKDTGRSIAVQPGIRCMIVRTLLSGAMEQEPFASCTHGARDELCGRVLIAVKDKMRRDMAAHEDLLSGIKRI